MSDDIKVTFDDTQDIKTSLDVGSIQYGQLEIGTTTTGETGEEAKVINRGSSSHAILDFTIPRGIKGDKGDKGEKGDTPYVPTKVSEFVNDSGYLTKVPSEYITETELNNKGYLTEETDPTVPNHVKSITEDDINNWNQGEVVISSSEPTTGEEVWLQKGKNLINLEGLMNYSLNETTGALESNNTRLVTPYIFLKAGTYTISCNVSRFAYVIYNNDKSFNSFISWQTFPNQIILNSDCYIRVEIIKDYNGAEVINKSDVTYLQLEQGEVATEYKPQTRSINIKNDNGEYEEFTDTVSSGISPNGAKVWFEKSNNILKFEDFTTTVNGVTFSMKNQVLTISGTATAYTQGGYIPIKKTLEETETLTAEVTGTGVIPKVAYSYNGQYSYPDLETLELQKDTYINQIYFIIYEGTTVNATVKLQLEKGSGYSGWQPYIEKKIHTKNDNGVYEEFSNEENIVSKFKLLKGIMLDQYGNDVLKMPNNSIGSYYSGYTQNIPSSEEFSGWGLAMMLGVHDYKAVILIGNFALQNRNIAINSYVDASSGWSGWRYL
jgi:hypothetical protein